VAGIMKIASVCRQTGFTYRDKVVAGGAASNRLRPCRRRVLGSSLAKGNSAKPAQGFRADL